MSDIFHADHLRSRALRVTKQRVAVLKALERHPHSDAASITVAAREDLGAISHQAVYDVLAALVAAQLVRKVDLAGSAALYEIHDGDEHGHAVCRVCGAVYDIEVGTHIVNPTAEGFVVDAIDVVCRGTCPTCGPGPARPRSRSDSPFSFRNVVEH